MHLAPPSPPSIESVPGVLVAFLGSGVYLLLACAAAGLLGAYGLTSSGEDRAAILSGAAGSWRQRCICCCSACTTWASARGRLPGGGRWLLVPGQALPLACTLVAPRLAAPLMASAMRRPRASRRASSCCACSPTRRAPPRSSAGHVAELPWFDLLLMVTLAASPERHAARGCSSGTPRARLAEGRYRLVSISAAMAGPTTSMPPVVGATSLACPPRPARRRRPTSSSRTARGATDGLSWWVGAALLHGSTQLLLGTLLRYLHQRCRRHPPRQAAAASRRRVERPVSEQPLGAHGARARLGPASMPGPAPARLAQWLGAAARERPRRQRPRR